VVKGGPKTGVTLQITLISVLLSTVISIMAVMNARTIEGHMGQQEFIYHSWWKFP